ncbi:ParB N-terminal domain-containing protein [Corallococcus sp. CA053C]|uniref:ParB/RepB/Spo0J family partition protein n=1 Tax=Corallococcus sp. CA053C TaxID=2316732 RepID=UPI001F40EF08|nr:ParB N-terminal domain-containing protein [Corallococcus sp. CA053C]
MSGTPGENATPSQQEGASDAASPEHGEGAAGTSHAQGAGGEVISEGASQAGAGGEAVSGAQVDATGQGDAADRPVNAGVDQAEAGGAHPGSGAGEAPGSVEGFAAAKSAAESEEDAGSSKRAAESGEGAASPKDAAESDEGAGSSKRAAESGEGAAGSEEGAGSLKSAVATEDDAASPKDAAEHGEGAVSPTDAQASSESTSTGRYVELSSGDDVPGSSGADSDGGGEAKDVQDAPRSGPVSGVDDALLNAGIWDVASRASQEDSGSAGPDGSEDAATPGEEPRVEAIEPRVMGQVTAMVLPLERLEEDTTFRLRDEGDVSELATDLARLGQLFPVDVRPRGDERYQLICGFRRVAALRFLKRDHVQVRVHEELSDEDALLLSLADAIHASPVEHDVLEAKRDSLEAEGRLTAPVRDMLEKALATEETLAPEGVEEEIDADELASDVAQRMGALNQDLSLLADVFAALDESRRAELLMQLRYSAQLVAYLEGL